MKGMIFDIVRNSYVDGPGIRTTVFFKGCNLRCRWCHNPESQSFQKEVFFYQDKCTGCGRCKDLKPENTGFICFNDAKEICGRDCTLDQILSQVMKDKAFYETSGGGVTFSGGECMLQIEFLAEILKMCADHNVHTAVDTAGNVSWAHFERILPYTDLFLYDIKAMNDETHQKYTGVSNGLILANLERLLQIKKAIWVRIPIISGVNDTAEEMEKIKAFFEEKGYPARIEFLPYHAMGEHKYAALGRTGERFAVSGKEKLEQLIELIFFDNSDIVNVM